MSKNRILIAAASLTLLCGTVFAHRHHHSRRSHFGPRITTIVRTAPTKRVAVVSRITKQDRFEMAIAYLNANHELSVKQYAKMTGLKKEIAEAELTVFANDIFNPIKPVPGKKNLYYLKG